MSYIQLETLVLKETPKLNAHGNWLGDGEVDVCINGETRRRYCVVFHNREGFQRVSLQGVTLPKGPRSREMVQLNLNKEGEEYIVSLSKPWKLKDTGLAFF